MKKLLLSVAFIFVMTSIVYADGNAFTPLNFNDTSYGNFSSGVPVTDITGNEAIGNGNIQNAITQLECAQADIRTDLLNCKTKYADVDAQYKLIKSEREALNKRIKSIEKRIKCIDGAKDRIKKNML